MMRGENITAKAILAHRHIYMKTEHMQEFKGKKVCKAKDKKARNRKFEGNILINHTLILYVYSKRKFLPGRAADPSHSCYC